MLAACASNAPISPDSPIGSSIVKPVILNESNSNEIKICFNGFHEYRNFTYVPYVIATFREPCNKTIAVNHNDEKYIKLLSMIEVSKNIDEKHVILNKNDAQSIRVKITQSDGNVIYLAEYGGVFLNQSTKKFSSENLVLMKKIINELFLF